jgi:hypothetical protein
MHGTDAGGNQQVAMLRAGFLVFQQAAGASETRRMTNVAGIGMGLMNAGEQLERAGFVSAEVGGNGQGFEFIAGERGGPIGDGRMRESGPPPAFAQ